MKKDIKKGKITMTITMAIACFALVAIMFMQFKIVNQTDITSIENMRETELRTELANWKSKYEETNQKYEETVKKIDEYKQTKQSNDETKKIVDNELEQVNMALGKTNVEGQGIEITITENQNEETEGTIKAYNLLILVDALKAAGAEAIQVNEQRIINMSDIIDINGTYGSFIQVNGQRILAPYVIKAIGNQRYLESALIGNGGYAQELRTTGFNVSINPNNKVKINKYNGEIKTKYIN